MVCPSVFVMPVTAFAVIYYTELLPMKIALHVKSVIFSKNIKLFHKSLLRGKQLNN